MNASRFASPAAGLDLDRLLRQAGRALWAALGVALAAHLIAVGINPFRQTPEKAPRPLTTRFVKREPRLTKPLELRKIPQPKRQLLRRQVRLAAARMDQVQATAVFDTRALIGQAVAARPSLAAEMPTSSMSLEPALASQVIKGVRHTADRIDLGLEMLDINSMDTGRYKAMVVQDPTHPQAIKGFVKIGRIYYEYQHHEVALSQGNDNTGMFHFVRALKRYTDLKVDVVDHMSLADERLLETPIIIPKGKGISTEQELEQLARYVIGGGFVFGSVPTEALVKYGGLIEGRDFFRERIPNDHPIYNCFFDLGTSGSPGYFKTRSDRQGLFIGDRLVTIDITDFQYFNGLAYDERHIHLWVNIVICALTQEGSITQRLMQMVE